ncbi:MAG: RpiB/LacA/LacB family sugar-phosphate isomerase [Phaeodactylibacter sp.]|nr:RpiB/LacA/LacB family sugar-phosphate isomerase [Phaeodactylibacter sp.]MCB9052860.1 RpiB/LacA/LacB family sugar-phosphate isomerase [Lewinellaceae bacterium]
MKIALGSDMNTNLAKFLAEELKKRGHEVDVYGALVATPAPWTKVAIEVAEKVAAGEYGQAVLCCWTGTGISLAANKVKGIRAALCGDAQTAAGARMWNDANILCLSLRATSEEVAREILDAWFENEPSTDEEDVACLRYLEEWEARH